ncbi:SAM-dependent methyltransferase [Salinibacter ruber]|nr:SAM-dependent methyltransferase [Salinibacter ruber]
MARYIAEEDPSSVLEVGCGDGRLFRALRREDWNAEYTGVEVAEYVVDGNRERHPEANWDVAGAYTLPVETGTVELVRSEFVVEHLVYTVRALREMVRAVKPGGQLLLIFPDFVCSGRLASQVLGFSPVPTALERLRQGRLVDSVVSLYDSRVRLPRALKTVREEVGPFPVNLRPQCLTYSEITSPDVDAVYIASKDEVEEWAYNHNLRVTFPWGRSGRFYENAHMSIHKPPRSGRQSPSE